MTSILVQGFGASGLGVVTVSGVPEVLKLRKRLLLLADKFAVCNKSLRSGISEGITAYSMR